MILSPPHLPSYAGEPVSVVDSVYRRRPYLAIFQDETETSGDRLERTEGICRVSHPTEEQFGRGGRSRLPARFVFLRGSAKVSTPAGAKSLWCMIRDGRGACAVGLL